MMEGVFAVPVFVVLASIVAVRSEPAAVSRRASKKDVAALLVASTWRRSNPERSVTTWDVKTWVFEPKGKLGITTTDAAGEMKVTHKWKVVRAGAKPIVQIGKKKFSITPCVKEEPMTLCLVGPAI